MTLDDLKMSGKLLILAAFAGGLLAVLSVLFFHDYAFKRSTQNHDNTQEQLIKLSKKQLNRVALSITVKVFSGKSWGSGILVHKNGQYYTVLSSAHLLSPGDNYRIQTPDGKFYPAKRLKIYLESKDDISLLEFYSEHLNYEIASLRESWTVTTGETVFAAGFSFEAEPNNSTGFVITQGQVAWLLQQSLVNGYQIGYTNVVGQGMSGGPLLNTYGQVIGINGLDKYPLWGDPYIFQNGSLPSKEMQERMRRLSWAIPIETVLKLQAL